MLPQELRFLLEKSIEPTPRIRVDIGASVKQLVTVVGGHDWEYAVALGPGQTDARRPDQMTRQLLDWGVIDREGHFGSAYAQCGYCEPQCCPACVDDIVMCDCCGAHLSASSVS